METFIVLQPQRPFLWLIVDLLTCEKNISTISSQKILLSQQRKALSINGGRSDRSSSHTKMSSADESKYGAIFADEAQDFNEIVRQYEEAYKRDPILDVRGDRDTNNSTMKGTLGLTVSTIVKASILIGISVLVMMAVLGKTGSSSLTTDTAPSTVDTIVDVPIIVDETPSTDGVDVTDTTLVDYVPEEEVTEVTTTEEENVVVEDEQPVVVVETPSVSSESLTFDTLNHAYPNAAKGRFAYPFLNDAALMEPYRQNTVLVHGVNEECTVSWLLKGLEETTSSFKWVGDSVVFDTTSQAHTFSVLPKKTGKYAIEIQEMCGETYGRSISSTIWVKYVRRELSTLNGADREEFLDAMKTLWEVNTRDGIEKYGINYKSLNYLAVLHNDGSGNGVCDEFQTGAGFINNQVLLSMYLEQSLRLVNPRVSLHYMDYSKYFESDAFKSRATNMDGGEWTELMTGLYSFRLTHTPLPLFPPPFPPLT